MDGFSVGDIQLPADFDQQIAAQLAAQGYNFAVQPSAPANAAPATAAPNFAVQQAETAAPAISNLTMVQPPPPPTPNFAVIKPSDDPSDDPSVNWAAYLSAYPDVAAAAAASGQDAITFAKQHFNTFGTREGRNLFSMPQPPVNPAFTVDKTGMANERGMGENPPNLAVAGATGTAAPTNLTVAGATGAVPIGPGVTLNPQGLTTPEVPTITATPAAPFDYSKLSTGEPQLVAAGASYKNNATGQMVPAGTDHYVTYTNDGDFAGTVMVAPGQKIRMVDAIDGSVVFEGTGPEGAKQATALANAMSQDKGRKAAWQIQAENEQGGYTTQAAERYDPKKPSLFSKLLPIAVAILGAVLLPGVGAAIGIGGLTTGSAAAAGSLAATLGVAAPTALGAGLGAATATAGLGAIRGDPLKDILISSAISGIGAGVVGPAVGKFVSNLAPGVVGLPAPGFIEGLTPTTEAMSRIAAGLGTGASNFVPTVSEVALNAARAAGTNNILGAGALTAVDKAVNAADRAPENPPAGADTFSSSSGTPSLAGGTGPDLVSEELVVTGRRLAEAAVANPYLDPNALAALVPGATFDMAMNAILNNPPSTTSSDQPNTLEEVVVTAPAAQKAALTTLQKTLIVGGLITSTALAAQLSASGVKTSPDEAKKLMDSVKEPFGVAAKVAGAGVLAAGALGDVLGGGGGSGGSGGGAGGTSSLQQQRANLSPIFRAQLGAPRGLFSVLGSTPTLPNSRPGNNFSVTPSGGTTPTTATLPATTATPTTATAPATATAGVPSTPSLSAYLALYPDVAAAAAKDPNGYGDADGDGTITARDFALGHYLRYGVKEGRKMGAKAGGAVHGYATGSSPRREFAVQGRGTGRSDSIPAVLSDGEYVMDAETVALLGDGSSKAGAAKLDKFRVSVRKHKGRDLARGKFSVNAKSPEAYLSGGRT